MVFARFIGLIVVSNYCFLDTVVFATDNSFKSSTSAVVVVPSEDPVLVFICLFDLERSLSCQHLTFHIFSFCYETSQSFHVVHLVRLCG